MGANLLLMLFRLAEQRYGLRLEAVERVVRAVEVTPLPGAPKVVLGAIDVQGSVLPVLGIRRRFGLAERAVDPGDQFVLARAAGRTVALAIDEALGVLEHPASAVIEAAQVAPGARHLRGVVRLEDGLVLIHDLENFLSLEEASALDEAMREAVVDAS